MPKKNEMIVASSDDSVGGGSRSGSVTSTPSSKGSASKSKRKSNSLPPETVEYLKAWMMSPEHIAHPYPTEQEKAQIMADTAIELKQLTNWFVNNRKRYWKPRVEARLQDKGHVQSNGKRGDGRAQQTHVARLGAPYIEPRSPPQTVRMTKSSSLASFSLLGTPTRAVSDVSYTSENESVGSTDDEMMHLSTGQETHEEHSLLTQTEYVNVHVLRPVGDGSPTLDDVTVLNNVPEDRVLRSYWNCAFTYGIPTGAMNNNEKVRSSGLGSRQRRCIDGLTSPSLLQIENRREKELARLRQRHLDLYLSQPPSSKRLRRKEDDTMPTPRPKFRRVSIELWKEACVTARDEYDHALPSLEEAATLFGFALS